MASKFFDVVRDAAVPQTMKSLRSFLELLNWQRNFNANYAQKVRPLQQLLRGKSLIREQWEAKHTSLFQQLQAELTSAPTVAHPDFDKRFHIFTDASDYALGRYWYNTKIKIGKTACRFQGAQEKLLCYFSRQFKDVETNYSISEKELLGVVEGMEACCPFVFGRPVKLYKD